MPILSKGGNKKISNAIQLDPANCYFGEVVRKHSSLVSGPIYVRVKLINPWIAWIMKEMQDSAQIQNIRFHCILLGMIINGINWLV